MAMPAMTPALNFSGDDRELVVACVADIESKAVAAGDETT